MTEANENTAPIHSARSLVVDWLDRPKLRAARLADELQFSIAWSEQSLPPGDQELRASAAAGEGGLSWLGGPALGLAAEEWPRRPDGIPLAHVATVNLWAVDQCLGVETQADWPNAIGGLPDHGVLQVFHDLTQTHGTDADDRDSGGWKVQWIPDPDFTVLANGPADLELPSDACQAFHLFATWSIPAESAAARESTKAFTANQRALQAYQWMWSWQRTMIRGSRPLPITHLYGHSQAGDLEAVEAILPACLPLTEPGDRYRLVLDIESWTALEGWFGDACPLEVWMRQSELDARDFDSAWCIVRAD
ncbi:uncharacterized protein DUF1963 [Frondihabitans sp. PhB188]|uniref:DUF1963 domain-containing protein n=1 Tax=Frondihabitans sp. PhB188 TaxID=2485200 RepID=UPI000F4AF395|nr:DUF1963 domain-containing protein [Frondihabitans sp. PhB188]ROQ41553.1 uncharacterized protein DUF1963 [Frondihabitans sp. PhB188]